MIPRNSIGKKEIWELYGNLLFLVLEIQKLVFRLLP